jgi:hypothetical protein
MTAHSLLNPPAGLRLVALEYFPAVDDEPAGWYCQDPHGLPVLGVAFDAKFGKTHVVTPYSAGTMRDDITGDTVDALVEADGRVLFDGEGYADLDALTDWLTSYRQRAQVRKAKAAA